MIDSSVWVSRFVMADVFHDESEMWLASLIEARVQIVGPALLIAEVGGAVSRRSGNIRLAKGIVSELRNLPNTRLVSIDEDLADDAGHLAAELRLKGADAVYLAVARTVGVPLVTWDGELCERGSTIHPVHRPSDLLSDAVSP